MPSALLAALLLPAPLAADNVQHGLRVPPGFEVTEFADSKLANDVFCMTLDPRGRVVVSGRGYTRLLLDDDGDGRADRACDIADGPKDGAQGLLWEGDYLYFTGDGGVRRWRIKDDRADGPAELVRAVKTGGEHDAHALRRGPDGWLYLLCGNNAGIDRRFAQLPTSPIKDPIAGCVVRFTPDLRQLEVVADGFRNPYGMDFNGDGELFTFDSDNERCVSLPWYEPTRFYHVVPGGHHGWLSPRRADWWRLPPYFLDVQAPVATLGRGSPTGVVCYRHRQFPGKYRGGFFLADWTFGRIWFVALNRQAASYTAEKQVFLEAVGDTGFAPTALAVHPTTGDLFVSIGGRGTRGAVYRIRYRPGAGSPGALTPLKGRSLDWQDGMTRELPQRAASGDLAGRLSALTLLRRHRAHFSTDVIERTVRADWDEPDRLIQQATADLLATLDPEARARLGRETQTGLQQTVWCLAHVETDRTAVIERACVLLAERTLPPGLRLDAVRLVQLALGDLVSPQSRGTVWAGYSPHQAVLDRTLTAKAAAALRAAFPAGDADLDREISRTLAVLEDDDPASPDKVTRFLTAVSEPVEDVHYLIVLSRLRGPRPAAVTARTAEALLALDRKLTQRRLNRDTNWPLRISELHAELARKDDRLNATLLASPEFGRPDHALFADCPGFDRRRAAAVLLARVDKDEEFPWDARLVRLVGELPEDRALSLLRRLWDHGGLEEAVLPLLARRPQVEDHGKFLEGLTSPQPATVRVCLDALDRLPGGGDGPELLALVRALRALPDGRESDPLRERIAGRLRRLTGQGRPGADKQAWTAWLERAHPKLAAQLGNADGVDVAAWASRLAKLDWGQGDAGRGRLVFTKASCAACHSGAQALGPDLRGVAGRFSRDDLFTAILQPSKDVSPRYRATLVATADGKTYQGLVIYEAVDSLILQTGPATTVRITNSQVVARRLTQTSLMPAGLLDKLADRDIADLYAYLKSLGAAGRAP